MATGAITEDTPVPAKGDGDAAVRRGVTDGGSGNRKSRGDGMRSRLRRKRFSARRSLLTELYKNDHIRTMYNLFTACFILLFVNIAVNDVAENSLLQIDRHLIVWHFEGVATVFFAWGLMFVSTLALYNCFRFWAFIRNRLQPSRYLQKLIDILTFVAYGLYMLLLLCGPPALLLRVSLAPVTTAVLIIEQIRMMMKAHAFVRSNLPRAMGPSEGRSDGKGRDAAGVKADDVEVGAPDGGPEDQGTATGDRRGVPDFGHFLYFHFAPTLVYRDSYPRNECIRWKVVAWHGCEVVGVALVCLVVFEQFLLHPLRSFWAEPPSTIRVASLYCRCLLPGLVFLLLGFYAFFHSWMNACAELLRFADRRFYEAWWATTKFSNYYRSWNLIVHDWMYEYLYLDLVIFFSESTADVKVVEEDGGHPQQRRPAGTSASSRECRCSQFACKALVFLVSAVFHEYVVAMCLRFLYPVLFVMFGVVGVALMYVPMKKGALGNMFMWLALSAGVASILTTYCVEFYARKDSSPCAAPSEDAILDLFIPRSWTCNGTLQL